MSEPTMEELKRAHQCMLTVLHALRMAQTLGGKNAKMHAGDMIRAIEQFKLGEVTEIARQGVTGPFYPGAN